MTDMILYCIVNFGLGVTLLVLLVSSGLAGLYLAYTVTSTAFPKLKLPGYEASVAYSAGRGYVIAATAAAVFFWLGEVARALMTPPWTN